jgi:hypothetical protein
MSPHSLYPIFNYGILLPWALLILAPRWRWTQRLVHGALIPLALCAAHGVLLITLTASKAVPPDAGGATLDAVARMFQVPWLALVCWIHYLAFDMFVGAWIARDAIRRNLPRLAVAPCMVVTLFFGPTGLLLYMAVRYAMTKTLSFDEERGGQRASAHAS